MKMRLAGAFVSLLLGCGRVGFDLCLAGCGDASSGITRGQVVAPGNRGGPGTLDVPVEQRVGDLVLFAVYGDLEPGIVDQLGETWRSLPAEVTCPNMIGSVGARLYYTTVTRTGTNTISVDGRGFRAGAFAITYRGVGSPAVDTQSGNVATAPGAALDAGMLETTDDDLIVALFADTLTRAPIAPGGEAHLVAHDGAFSAMIEELPGTAGTYMPTATLPSGITSNCWVGVSVALRPGG